MDSVEKTIIIIALLLRARAKRRKRRYWVHPLCSRRLMQGQFYKLHDDLCNHPREFFKYYKMSKNSFEYLLHLIGPKITFRDTTWRRSIPAKERLSVTLRYLATGNSFYSLHLEYLLGATTVREIVKDTCVKLWECLRPIYLPDKSEEDWKKIAKQFFITTNFPNCIGAVDGKQIRLRKPCNSGSLPCDYEQFCSIVLLGVVDADYYFTTVETIPYGANSDVNVFKNSNFGKTLTADRLEIPQEQPLPNDSDGKPMPFVLIGDEAFASSKHVLRPYPRKNITMKQRVYNYRLCRARRMVECTFGIMANKWGIFHKPLDVEITFADAIVKACSLLHNFVRKKDGVRAEDEFYESPLQAMNQVGLRGDSHGLIVREYFADYFISPQGSVPWQYESI